MKKKKLIILISSAIVLAAAILVTVIIIVKHNKKPSPKIDDFDEKNISIHLDRPQNLSLTSSELSWNIVENAESYIVSCDQLEYVVDANSFDLSQITNDKSLLSVRATSKEYLDSPKSIELYYVKNINGEELVKINNALSSFFQNYSLSVSNEETTLLTNKLCYLGLSSEEVNALLTNVNCFIENIKEQKALNKSQLIEPLLDSFIALFDNDLLEYQSISSINYIFEVYLENRIEELNNTSLVRRKQSVQYYEKNELIKCFTDTLSFIKNLSNSQIQDISYTLYYIHLYRGQMDNVLKTLAGSSLLGDSLYNDLITLKDTELDLLMSTLPTKSEYSSFVNLFGSLCDSLFERYLQEQIDVNDLKNYLINIYSINHYILSFIKILDKNDIKSITNYLKTMYLSIPQNDRDDLEKTLSNLADLDKFIDFSLESVKTNIQLLNLNEEFFNGLSELESFDEFLEYINFSDYFVLSKESVDKMIEYFTNLLPEEVDNYDVFVQYFKEALEKIDYLSCITFDQENFVNSITTEKIMNAITSGAGAQGIINELEITKYIYIDRDKLIDEISSAFADKFNELYNFVEDELLVDFDNALLKMGITEDIKIDINGFIDNIIDLAGLNNCTIQNIQRVIDNVSNDITSYIDEYYPYLYKINNIITIFEAFNSMSDINDYESMDISMFMDTDFDYLTMFNLMNLLNNRYSKFMARYKPVFNNGTNINTENLKDIVFSASCYYLFGIDAYYMDDIVIDLFGIGIKSISMLLDYQSYIEKYQYYQGLVNKYNEIDYLLLWENEEYFNERIDGFRYDIKKAYEDLISLKEDFFMEELFSLTVHASDLFTAKEEEDLADLLIILNDVSRNLYNALFEAADYINNNIDKKTSAIVDLYTKLHELIDPAYTFIEETISMYEGISGEALYESLSIYLVRKSDTIIGFYNRDLVEQIGTDLGIIFEETGIDFDTLTNNVCDYLDRLIEKMEDPMFFPNLIDDVKVVVDTIDLITSYEELLNGDIESIRVLADNEVINFLDLENAYKKLIADALSYNDAIKPNIVMISNHIDEFLETNLTSLLEEMFTEYENRIKELEETLPTNEDLAQYGSEYVEQLINDYLESMTNVVTESAIYQTISEVVDQVSIIINETIIPTITNAIQEIINNIDFSVVNDFVDELRTYLNNIFA